MNWLSAFLAMFRQVDTKAHTSIADETPEETPDPYRAEPEILEPDPAPDPMAITTIGAWAGNSSLANPVRDVAAMIAAGVNRIDIIINDHSAWREPRKFTMRDTQKIATLAKVARDSGMSVHLMSWIMPHREYIEGACAALLDLHEKVPFDSVIWDAEEPWTLAKRSMGYKPAAALVGELLDGAPFRQGVTGIRYASKSKLGPLIAVCDYAVPQCYSTSSSKADPSTVAAKGVKQWRGRFGDDVQIVPALAAYRQKGIKGHTEASAIQAAADGARGLGGTVIYWGANSIRKSPVVSRAIARVRG